MQPKRALVVDDEPSVRDVLVDALRLSGFEVDAAADGLEALNLLRRTSFDILITDVNMPKLSGYDLVDKLRSAGDYTPVIFLTARNQRPDISMGFTLGADDYVAKPFGLEELILRINAILRTSPREVPKILRCGPVGIDLANHKVTLQDDEISLSPTEYKLLCYLMEHKNKVLTKNAILDAVWGMGFLETAGVLDTFISYLRKKVHRDGFEGIVTVRGVGYKIVDAK